MAKHTGPALGQGGTNAEAAAVTFPAKWAVVRFTKQVALSSPSGAQRYVS